MKRIKVLIIFSTVLFLFLGSTLNLYAQPYQSWEKSFELLCEFNEEKGRWPKQKESYKRFNIGSWYYKQKTARNLSKNKIKKLKKIGVPLETKPHQSWNNSFKLLKEFYEKKGRWPKPGESYKRFNIGNWLANQKQSYGKDKLSQGKIDKLKKIKIPLKIQITQPWEKSFKILKEFYEEKGRLPKQGESYKGIKIGNWLTNQKTAYENGKLSQGKIDKLKEFDVSSKTKLYQSWEKSFELLCEFNEEKGRWPKQVDTYKGVNIGWWLTTQQQNYKNNKLSKDRVKKLKGIGVPLIVDQSWEESFKILKKFYEEEGRWPKRTESNIGEWLRTQRKNYKKGKLSKDRMKKLEGIGVPLKVRVVQSWEAYFKLLKEFKKEKGRWPKQVETYKGVNIGNWLNNQRQRYKKGELSKKKVKKLEGIEVPWEVRRGRSKDRVKKLEEADVPLKVKVTPSWEKSFKLLKDFYEEKGRWPKQREEFGIWLNNQRQRYKKGELSKDRVKKLEGIGVPWEVHRGRSKEPSKISDDIDKFNEESFIEFFKLAKKLGIHVTDKVAFRLKELSYNLTPRMWESLLGMLTLEMRSSENNVCIFCNNIINLLYPDNEVPRDIWVFVLELLDSDIDPELKKSLMKSVLQRRNLPTDVFRKIGEMYKILDNPDLVDKWEGKLLRLQGIPSVEEMLEAAKEIYESEMEKDKDTEIKLEEVKEDRDGKKRRLAIGSRIEILEEYYKNKTENNEEVTWPTKAGKAKFKSEKYGEVDIGKIVKYIRIAYNNKYAEKERKNPIPPLADEYIERLDNIDFVWKSHTIKDEVLKIEDKIEILEDYYKKNKGEVDLSTRKGKTIFESERYGIVDIGPIVTYIRTAYNNRKYAEEEKRNDILPLTDNQVKRLEKIDFIWRFYGVRSEILRINDKIEVLEEYYHENKRDNENVEWPPTTKRKTIFESEKYGRVDIGEIISYIRTTYDNKHVKNTMSSLTDAHEERLGNIDFVWKSYGVTMPEILRINDKIKVLEEYYHEKKINNEDIKWITARGKTIFESERYGIVDIGQIVSTVRTAYNNKYFGGRRKNRIPLLTDDQEKRLNELDFDWGWISDPTERRKLVVDSKIEILEEYYNKKQENKEKIDWPTTRGRVIFESEKYGEVDISLIVIYIRTAYSNKYLGKRDSNITPLTDKQIKSLNKIKFILSARTSKKLENKKSKTDAENSKNITKSTSTTVNKKQKETSQSSKSVPDKTNGNKREYKFDPKYSGKVVNDLKKQVKTQSNKQYENIAKSNKETSKGKTARKIEEKNAKKTGKVFVKEGSKIYREKFIR